MKNEPPAIGIIGGSGLYQMEEVRDAAEHKIDTHSKAEVLKKLKQEKKGRPVNLVLLEQIDFSLPKKPN